MRIELRNRVITLEMSDDLAVEADLPVSVKADIETSSSDGFLSYTVNSSRKKSNVWGFFEGKGTRPATCRLCSKDYAYCSGTSNLRNHLLRIHPGGFRALSIEKQPLQQSTVDGLVICAKCSESRSKQITKLLANLVACDIHPQAIVEGKGFKTLLNFIEPDYKVSLPVHILPK